MRRWAFVGAVVVAACGGGDDAAGPDATPAAYCGDGILDDGEVCDDGNASFGDACNPLCQRAECGNGFVDPGTGETCDDANADDTDGCTSACRIASCGNLVLD